MKTFITFGQAHVHRVNGKTFDCDCVAVFEAETEEQARRRAFELFGPKWAFSYPETQWKEDHMRFYPRGYIKVE